MNLNAVLAAGFHHFTVEFFAHLDISICGWQYQWMAQEPHEWQVCLPPCEPELCPITSMTINTDQHLDIPYFPFFATWPQKTPIHSFTFCSLSKWMRLRRPNFKSKHLLVHQKEMLQMKIKPLSALSMWMSIIFHICLQSRKVSIAFLRTSF